MPTLVNIRISSTSFVKVFTAYGSSICFGGFCLPPVTPYMSCPKELTSRRTRWEYSAVISVLPVRRVQRKASSSDRRLTVFSHSSDGFVGHYVSVLFERTASRMYRPICCISLTLDAVSPCLIAEITLLFGQLNLRKDFWEELNAYHYSGDLQIATSRRILFLTFFGNVFSLIGIFQ